MSMTDFRQVLYYDSCKWWGQQNQTYANNFPLTLNLRNLLQKCCSVKEEKGDNAPGWRPSGTKRGMNTLNTGPPQDVIEGWLLTSANRKTRTGLQWSGNTSVSRQETILWKKMLSMKRMYSFSDSEGTPKVTCHVLSIAISGFVAVNRITLSCKQNLRKEKTDHRY